MPKAVMVGVCGEWRIQWGYTDIYIYGSLPKLGDPNIDLKTLLSLLLGPLKRYP